MKINRNSWHYRIQRFFNFDIQSNLCAYCRGALLAVLLGVFVIPLCASAGAVIVTLPFWWTLHPGDVIDLVIFVGITEIVMLLLGLGVLVRDRRAEERHVRERAMRASGVAIEVKEPSLLWTWVSAKHRKICPLLTFETRRG
jgi:hypothetical protein